MQKEAGGIPVTKENPQLFDYDQTAGSVDGHYFVQDIYVAELVSESGIKKHFDIGSKLDGFISHLLANICIDEVVMLDIRPFPYSIRKLSFTQTDATSLSNIEDNSIDSISSLHAIEHFGLGRYGDPVDPMACFKAMKSIQRVAAKNGRIYISFPVKMQDECHFNAHRLFCPNTVVEQFDECALEKLAFVKEGLKLESYDESEANRVIRNREYELGEYDCGIFVFRKH
ncbi:MAG: DUF268 domain-containing protein [Lachnospiraceae bacterium]|nr:DUF268 domain-containing protein [Lachnospiraceae bacterium]